MANFTQILASHGRILVLDATAQRVHIGLFSTENTPVWHVEVAEAGQVVFTGTQAVLQQVNLTIEQIGAFVYCEGPGSMLGTRTIAMAIRTWVALKDRPVYRYQSLALAARFAWETTQPRRALGVIADARRDTWHCQSVQADGTLLPLQRLPAAELPSGELFTPETFRAWSKPPRPIPTCRYDLAGMLPDLTDQDFFQPTTSPDPFQHEAPEYKKWSAQPHSSATVTSR